MPVNLKWQNIYSSIRGDAIGRSSSLNKSLSALFKNLPLDPILAIDFVVWEQFPPDSITIAAADFCKSATDVAPRPKFARAWSAQAVDPRPSLFTSSAPAWDAVAVLEFGSCFASWLQMSGWDGKPHDITRVVSMFSHCAAKCVCNSLSWKMVVPTPCRVPSRCHVSLPQHMTNSCDSGWMAKKTWCDNRN